jgi:tetratricopeptide (TPR) repeat protein
MLLDEDLEAAQRLAQALITVGLAEDRGHGHLGLDPALPAYLARELDDPEALEARWARAMAGLLGFLYQQVSTDSQQAFDLTRLELANLLRLLDWAEAHAEPGEVVDWANNVETLTAPLGLAGALARAAAVRERAARRLEGQGWGHAAYLHQSSAIDRLLEQGDLNAALGQAQALLQRCLAAGDGAYPEAGYDTAMAHWRFGRVLSTSGRADAALGYLQEARRRFEALGPGGERMASACLTEQGDCLTDLGRLDEAAASYEDAMKLDAKAGRDRDVAVGKFQLATVRKDQGRYPEALEAYAKARRDFEALGEPAMVAAAWHQTGMVYRQVGDHDRAEQAYRQSLAFRVKHKLCSDEASSLVELGNLYLAMGRLEEAVNCYRQAAEIYVQLQDLRYEGLARSNLANTLLTLGRLPEAREEVQRAIECKRPFGHVAEPWTTWMILHGLEQAAGNPEAAAQARRQAIAAYRAYRRDGGEPKSLGGQLCDQVAQAIAQGATDQTAQGLAQLAARSDLPAYLQALIPKLQAILEGARDPALAADPALDYYDAAELALLLERLGQA